MGTRRLRTPEESRRYLRLYQSALMFEASGVAVLMHYAQQKAEPWRWPGKK